MRHNKRRSQITMDVGLTHFECQPFIERRADWDCVYKATVYTGKRNSAALAARLDRLSRREAPIPS